MLGEVLPLKDKNYLYIEKGLFARSNFPISLKLENFTFEEKNREFLDFISTLFLYDHANSNYTQISLNLKGPATYRGIKFYQTDKWGYVVSFLYNGSLSKQNIITHYYLEHNPKERNSKFRGEGQFEGLPYYFKIESFLPDMMNPESFRAELPGIEKLTLILDNKKIGQYTILPGQILKLKDGEFRFIGVSLWTEIAIKHNDGSFLIYGGGLFSSLGGLFLTFRYLRRS